MKLFFLITTFILVSACSTSINRGPANKKSNFCLPESEVSEDAVKYWRIAKNEEEESSFDDLCELKVLSLHPTQFAVGILEVERKVEKILAMNEKKFEKYIQKNPEPIIIGPRGEFYIIDHHHLGRALYEAKIKNTKGIILENWYKSDEKRFWTYMQKMNFVYLVDQNGKEKSIRDLTLIQTVVDLADDPYRTLAGRTRCEEKSKCTNEQWLKVSIPFIEFRWAEHFRKTYSVSEALKNYGESDFSKVIEAAGNEVRQQNGQLP